MFWSIVNACRWFVNCWALADLQWCVRNLLNLNMLRTYLMCIDAICGIIYHDSCCTHILCGLIMGLPLLCQSFPDLYFVICDLWVSMREFKHGLLMPETDMPFFSASLFDWLFSVRSYASSNQWIPGPASILCQPHINKTVLILFYLLQTSA